MATAAIVEKSGKVVIRNVGLMLSGDLEAPILDADTIVVDDGRIVAVGSYKDCDTEGARTVIDSHVHPVAGDWMPRQNQLGWSTTGICFACLTRRVMKVG